MRHKLVGTGSLALSLLVHGAVVGVGALLFANALRDDVAAPARLVAVELERRPLELPEVVVPAEGEAAPPEPSQLEPGGDRTARPDLDRRGRGGSDLGSAALNLSSSNDGLTLQRAPLDRVYGDQVQRTATARRRGSPDDRRAVDEPSELALESAGALDGRFRTPGEVLGTNGAAERATLRGHAGDRADVHEPDSERQRALVSGSPQPSDGAARDHATAGQSAGKVLAARPWALQSRPATPALRRDETTDDVDSDREVASRVASLIHASSAGGRLGQGAGGESAPGMPASGGTLGPGSTSTPNGSGAGVGPDYARDPRLQGYFRELTARLDQALAGAFPDWAIREGRGGLVVFEMTLAGNGRIAAVRVVRPSGIEEYDRNVVVRVKRVGSFGPLPQALGSHALVRVGWDSLNPTVGRDGPGPGGRALRPTR